MRNEKLGMHNKQGTMNKESGVHFCALLFVIFSLFFGCDNMFQPPNKPAPVEAGYGRVSVNFVGGQERTVFPAKVFDNYVYIFTRGEELLELSLNDDGLFTLEVGAWQIYVEAYVNEVDSGNLAATGTASFTVSTGPTVEVTVELDAVVTAGYGTFTYTIQYPATAEAEITLKKLPEMESVDLTSGDRETDEGIIVITQTAENIPAGYYLLTVQISNGGWHAGISEAVHIYPFLTTEYEVEFDEDDLLLTVVNIAAIEGITPIIGQAPAVAITETEQYSGVVTWSSIQETFAANTEYTAAITLTAKDGYTLQDVPASFFTVARANSVSNAAGSGEIIAVFTTPLRVTNTTEWTNALTTIRGGGNDKSYSIEVVGSVGIGGITAINSTTGLGTVTGITVTLMGNGRLYLTGQGSILRVGANQTLVIDSENLILEGRNNNTSAVYVYGTNARLELKNGTIRYNNYRTTQNTPLFGGGVYISGSGSSFTMSGGSISGNSSFTERTTGDYTSAIGGGVYVSGGSFTMSGGSISGNSTGRLTSGSSEYGGGVYVTGNGSSFTMTGGIISNNTSANGGGVYMGSNTSFTMTEGTISNNRASGGSTGSSGGGVRTNGAFTMTGGTISNNTATSTFDTYGGGVYASNFTMSGGTISNNTISGGSGRDTYGGGVCAYGNSTMTGGIISGNTANSANARGGGVYRSDGTFTIGGTAQIYDNTVSNTPNNVYLNSDPYRTSYIAIGSGVDAPTHGMNVYVQTAREDGVIMQGGMTGEAVQYFHADQDSKFVMLSGEQLVIVDYISSITAPIWREGNTVSLAAPTVIPPGQTITAQGWQTSDTGSGRWSDFTPPSTADMSYNGKYLRYYATSSSGQTYYSNTVTIRVISATGGREYEVTIAMWDSYGDGWDGNGALRISINGIDLSTNVKKTGSGNGPGYYTFTVNSSDEVIFYWIAGSSQDENAFAVYYSDDPPSPAFSPTSGAAVDTSRILIYRQYNSMGSVAGGAELGRFTVQ